MTKEKVPQQVAADIASMLRSRPELWGKGDRPRPKCLMEHIGERLHRDSKDFHELREMLRERIRARGGKQLFVAEWNDEPETTVEDVIAICEEVANV